MQPGTVEGYWAVVSELSRLNRLDRRILGRKMEEKMQQANDPRYHEGHSLMFLRPDEGLLFYASDSTDREERAFRLSVLSSTAYAAKDLRKIIGIATEPLIGHGRSFDAIILEGVEFKNKNELKQQAKYFLGEGKHYSSHEYSDE